MNVRLSLLTEFGLGRLRPAPGTWGSLPLPLLALLFVWMAAPIWLVSVIIAIVGTAFGIACARFGHLAEAHFGKKDPSSVVADEVAGQALPLLVLPWMPMNAPGAWLHNGAIALTAFIAFRVFDITKPPPVRRVERIGGGVGILIDDLVAGVYAAIVTQPFVRLALPAILG